MWITNEYGEMVWVNNDHEYTMTVSGTYGSSVTYEESYAVDNAMWDRWSEVCGFSPKKKCIFDE